MIVKINITPFIIAITIILMSCNGGQLRDVRGDSVITSTTLKDTSGPEYNHEVTTISSEGITEDNRQFMNEMNNKLDLNIKLSKAAINLSSDDAIKNLGKTVADQQTELLNKLKAVAETKNINFTTNQTSTAQDALTSITSKRGNDFNATYLDRIIKDSETAIDWLERRSSNLTDEQLKQFASSAIPIFKQHHDAAKALRDKN